MLDSVQLRMPVSGFDETIREGLVNYLAHADYVQGFPSLKIDVFDGWFCFINPGKCLYHHSNFFWGGVGGGPLIYKASVQN